LRSVPPTLTADQPKAVEHGARHRATKAIGELIERPARAEPRKGALDDRLNRLRPHRSEADMLETLFPAIIATLWIKKPG
jgi:hypothetical protein